ncbi:MAG: hypothetical protein FJZ56_06430 [Chlamydiae bacterium]|nr:hypothetical protein [Chlamydiota bacterium]
MRLFSIFILAVAALFKLDADTYAPGQEPYRLSISIDPSGAILELDDHSMWRIEGNDSRAQVKNWLPNDAIVIYPVMYTFLTGTRFYIYNQRTRTSANAELSFGPTIGGPCNNRITYIDYRYGEVHIQDGQGNTCFWIVDPQDIPTIQNWRLYQSIILGSNRTWPANWASHCEYILINVECNDYIRANNH